MRAGAIYHLEQVPDPQGRNPKGSYVIIVTNAEEMLPVLDEPIFVVCCTASAYLHQVCAGEAVELPWHPRGMVHTGFRRRTWAIPNWLFKVRPSQFGDRIGFVPGNCLAEIIERLPPDPVGDLT